MSINLSVTQTIVFLQVLQILRNDRNKFTRKKIYELYIDHKIDNIESLDKQTKLLIDQLNGDFDEIGFLVEEFNIYDSLFGLYSDTIRRVWIALQNNIQREKNERKKHDPTGTHFGKHFRKLAFEAKKYRDKNNLKEPGFTNLRNF
jgi:hypothetical protein|tara:strand:+ start:2142 stop:2579 length:438 start_codon:yes stop_codon:yes gene_type:complete